MRGPAGSGGDRREPEGAAEGEEGTGISASSISLFDVRPAPNSAVRATLAKWLGRLQRKCLGTTRHPLVARLRLPTKPYRYSVLYRHSQLTFFPERLLLSAFRRLPEKKERTEGEKPAGTWRPRESTNFPELFFDRPSISYLAFAATVSSWSISFEATTSRRDPLWERNTSVLAWSRLLFLALISIRINTAARVGGKTEAKGWPEAKGWREKSTNETEDTERWDVA